MVQITHLTEEQLQDFNKLHVEIIVQQKGFRNWAELTPGARMLLIDAAEKQAKKEYLNRNQ